jgi:hypothetical protein
VGEAVVRLGPRWDVLCAMQLREWPHAAGKILALRILRGASLGLPTVYWQWLWELSLLQAASHRSRARGRVLERFHPKSSAVRRMIGIARLANFRYAVCFAAC